MPEENVAALKPPYAFDSVAKPLPAGSGTIPRGRIWWGQSLEGLLAYETARQLELIEDSEPGRVARYTSHHRQERVPLVQRACQRMKREVFHLYRLWHMPRSERASYLRARLEWLKVLLRNRRLKSAYAGNREHASRDRLFEEILFLAALNYAPLPYGGRMLFLRPQQRPKDPYADLTFDWKNLARTLQCVEVPGDHTTMFHEPNAQVLAERIRRAIDACRSRRQGATPAADQSAKDRAQAA
jgi:thioesterase domain-containing protein